MKKLLPLMAIEVWLLAGYLLHHGGGSLPLVTAPVSVLIVEETEDRDTIPAGQRDAIEATAPGSLREWLKNHGEEDPLRVVDKDSAMDRDSPKWQAAMKLPRERVPWIVVQSKGQIRHSGPLPEKIEDTMAVLKRYGG